MKALILLLAMVQPNRDLPERSPLWPISVEWLIGQVDDIVDSVEHIEAILVRLEGEGIGIVPDDRSAPAQAMAVQSDPSLGSPEPPTIRRVDPPIFVSRPTIRQLDRSALAQAAGPAIQPARPPGVPENATLVQVIEPPAGPASSPSPLAVAIAGPVDVVVGDPIDVFARTSGEVTSYAWDVYPPSIGLRVLDGGREAIFTNREPGEYLISCAVGGNGGQVALDQWLVTILPGAAPLRASAQASAPAGAPIDDVAGWLSGVQSANAAVELAAVAQQMRSTAQVMRSGQAGASGDPIRLVERGLEAAIGPAAFRGWETFFVRLRADLAPRNQTGELLAPTAWAKELERLAGLLEYAATPQ